MATEIRVDSDFEVDPETQRRSEIMEKREQLPHEISRYKREDGREAVIIFEPSRRMRLVARVGDEDVFFSGIEVGALGGGVYSQGLFSLLETVNHGNTPVQTLNSLKEQLRGIASKVSTLG